MEFKKSGRPKAFPTKGKPETIPCSPRFEKALFIMKAAKQDFSLRPRERRRMSGIGFAFRVSSFCVPSHSVLSATTGSFLAAAREGMSPAISVKSMLIASSMSAPRHGRRATFLIPPSL